MTDRCASEKKCENRSEDDPNNKRVGIRLDPRILLEPEMTPRTDIINQVGPDVREKESWIQSEKALDYSGISEYTGN